MRIPERAVYQTDALVLLERLEAEEVTVAYIDPPPYPPLELPEKFAVNEDKEETLRRIESQYQEELQTHLIFLSKVFQQIYRILSPHGNAFIQSQHHLTGPIRQNLDHIFGMRNFRREIIWPSHPMQIKAQQITVNHDTIFHYSKTSSYTYNPQFRMPSKEKGQASFGEDERGVFKMTDLTSPVSESTLQYEWKGIAPPPQRSWRYTKEKLDELEKAELIIFRSEDMLPALKTYLHETAQVEVGSVWDDIEPIKGDLLYPEQKPLTLLERIILMGSNPDDLILDPFCGSGTALVAAQKTHRRWLGCDLSPAAYAYSIKRLEETLKFHPGLDFYCGDQAFIENMFPIVYDLYILDPEGAGKHKSSTKKFLLDQPIDVEETRHCEFKQVTSPKPIDSIKNNADEYVVAFLNSEGGSIYWGIRDHDRVVVGVNLSYEERDKMKQIVANKLAEIQPAISPSLYHIYLHPVEGKDGPIHDLYVVEIAVPRISTKFLYFTGSGVSYVKTDAGKKKLTVLQIHEEIVRRNYKQQ